MALMKRIYINLYIGYTLVANRFERSLLFCDELYIYIYIFESEFRGYNTEYIRDKLGRGYFLGAHFQNFIICRFQPSHMNEHQLDIIPTRAQRNDGQRTNEKLIKPWIESISQEVVPPSTISALAHI